MKRHHKVGMVALIALGLALSAGLGQAQPGQVLHLEFRNFAQLQNGFHYENWAIINDSVVPAGKFNVIDGQAYTLSGDSINNNDFIVNADLNQASAIVLTIEPAGDDDTVPATTHYVSGSLAGGVGTLTLASRRSFGDDFSSATGEFILATPTNGNNTEETSGVWFLNPNGPRAGLSLPTLPAGWTFEGWAVIDGVPVSTGRFQDPNGPDTFAGFSGPLSAPPFPGEDFIFDAPNDLAFPVDLSGSFIVITIEPEPDDSASPFDLKPLIQQVPLEPRDHVVYSMINQAASFPVAFAVFR